MQSTMQTWKYEVLLWNASFLPLPSNWVLLPRGYAITMFVHHSRDSQLIYKPIHINNSMCSHYIETESVHGKIISFKIKGTERNACFTKFTKYKYY